MRQGLDDERRAGLESALAARAAEIERLLGECKDHIGSKPQRLAEALGCYREVMRLDVDHEQAMQMVAWLRVDVEQRTVEGYYGFEQSYRGSKFARLARHKLGQLEEEYWQSIKDSGDKSKFLRYLEIYPNGNRNYRDIAQSRSSEGE